jgi:hypothetical protein
VAPGGDRAGSVRDRPVRDRRPGRKATAPGNAARAGRLPSLSSILGRRGTSGSTVRRTGSRASRCEPPVTVPVLCSSPRFPTLPGSSQVPRQPSPGGSTSTAARPSLAAPGRSSGAASRSTLFLTSPVAGRRAGCRRSWRPSPGSPLSFVRGRRPTAGQPPSRCATSRIGGSPPHDPDNLRPPPCRLGAGQVPGGVVWRAR